MGKSKREPFTRRPTQYRAQETFELILDGAAKIITTEGFDKVGTTRVATVAGVNIATLYQYFRNRDEILLHLAGRVARHERDTVTATLSLVRDRPLAECIPLLVKAIVGLYSRDSQVRSSLRSFLPREPLDEIDALLDTFFEDCLRPLERPDAGRVALLARHILTDFAELTTASRSDWVQDGSLSREITRLLLAYLLPGQGR